MTVCVSSIDLAISIANKWRNCYYVPVEPDRPMTKEELARLRRDYSMLHQSRVEHYYREAWRECKMDGDKLPRPAAIQNLVTAWKQLWRWSRR